MQYGYPVPDSVGQATKTFDFITKALNYGEDRRRAQEKEDLQMESMRNQNKASALQLESAEEERQLKKDLQIIDPYVAQYAEWEKNKYPPEMRPQAPEGLAEAFARRGVKLSLSGDNPEEAAERAKAAKEALAMLSVAKTKYASQLPVGQQIQIDLPDLSHVIERVDPNRVRGERVSAVDGRKYLLNGLSGWFAEKKPDGKVYVMPGLVRVDLDESGQPIPDSQRVVPASEGGTDATDAKLSFKPLEEYEAKLQAASLWNGAFSYAGLAAAGSKSAATANADRETRRRWAALDASPVMKKLQQDQSAHGDAVRDILEIYKSTGGKPEEAEKVVSSALVKRAERTDKNAEDVREADTTIQAYAANKDSYPRTSQIAGALQAGLRNGTVSGKAALKITTLAAAGEDRERNEREKAKDRAALRGRGGYGGEATDQKAFQKKIDSETASYMKAFDINPANAPYVRNMVLAQQPESKMLQLFPRNPNRQGVAIDVTKLDEDGLRLIAEISKNPQKQDEIMSHALPYLKKMGAVTPIFNPTGLKTRRVSDREQELILKDKP